MSSTSRWLCTFIAMIVANIMNAKLWIQMLVGRCPPWAFLVKGWYGAARLVCATACA